MNQILITEKLYITPELKRKKRMYKIKFRKADINLAGKKSAHFGIYI